MLSLNVFNNEKKIRKKGTGKEIRSGIKGHLQNCFSLLISYKNISFFPFLKNVDIPKKKV